MNKDTMMMLGMVALKKDGRTMIVKTSGFDGLAFLFGFLRFLFAGLYLKACIAFILTFMAVLPGMIFTGITFRESYFQHLLKSGWEIDQEALAQ